MSLSRGTGGARLTHIKRAMIRGGFGRVGAAGAYFFLPEASCSTTMSSTYTFDGASAGGFFQS